MANEVVRIFNNAVPGKDMTCSKLIAPLARIIEKYGDLPVEAVITKTDTKNQEFWVSRDNDDKDKLILQIPICNPKEW